MYYILALLIPPLPLYLMKVKVPLITSLILVAATPFFLPSYIIAVVHALFIITMHDTREGDENRKSLDPSDD